ncbi:MAG: hypothetical protein AABW48_00935 [Nanoarchaeota archaeon]
MTNKGSLDNILEGVLHFYSETGTEGGHWAFQDSRFISPNTTRYTCKKCSLCWDKKQNPSAPRAIKRSSPDPGGFPDYCLSDAHQFELICKEDWSYEGLRILEDGDTLTIYNPSKKKKLWSGVINLKQYDLFTEHASGLWIHADQIGIEREVWAEYFFKNSPARLISAKISAKSPN